MNESTKFGVLGALTVAAFAYFKPGVIANTLGNDGTWTETPAEAATEEVVV